MKEVTIRKINLATVVRGLVITAILWPVLIFVVIKKWKIDHGYDQKKPFDGAVIMVLSFWCVPIMIALYIGLIWVWWAST